ncbi:hypothetical protein N7510_010559 [Penicillium lagena]|uniref:uncharacterized protein n=1 Tax=Penicillium lagena TaxID=94218 RepID=UPI002541BBA6|nr:uncharacterized protein N7510_010559 [Penicillium lagena]KAJ5601025.1 hypothetical protein N7510_010559 [Penicillium lagena]
MMQPTTPGPSSDRRDPVKGSPSSLQESNKPFPQHGHQRLVFTDPVALRYLEEDPSTDVLHRRTTLQGYELYIVEQWACSRTHPTFVISTYTGDPAHKVIVGVLSVPTDESTWSPRLQLYFDAVKQYGARKKDTPLGTVMVTDLGSFPSALSVIPVPEGDIKKHREDFIVNENLKRLGCAGRAGLKIQTPSAATEAKFHQLYRTSEKVPLYHAVFELVKQCQVALLVFGKLAPEYIDGLLCDVTEGAVADWWTDIGTDLYNLEPSDGNLGPTSVAALLGTLLGARNRLHAYGAPVAKDAFDISSLKRGIGNFQKSQKMARTRRLDRQTLDRLHRVTAKAANAEGWTDAVKSTMAELSGQGGEMVMGMVRGREKGGIADIETLDLDTFVQCCSGERAKWLWLGKPRKSGLDDRFTRGPAADMMFTTDEQGGYVWTSQRRNSTQDLFADRLGAAFDRPSKVLEPSSEERDPRRKGVSGRVSDARAGLGRFKDAVGLPGLRSHHSKPSRDGVVTHDLAYHLPIDSDTEIPPPAKEQSTFALLSEPKKEISSQPLSEDDLEPLSAIESDTKAPEIHIQPAPQAQDFESPPQPSDQRAVEQPSRGRETELDMDRTRTRSTAASSEREEQVPGLALMALRRPQSCGDFNQADKQLYRRDNYYARHLSFTAVEEVVLGWEPLIGKVSVNDTAEGTLEEAIIQEDILASEARIFSSRMLELSQYTAPWVERQVDSVDGLNQILYDRHEELNSVYLERLGEFQRLRERSSDLLTDEQAHLGDSVKRVELLGAKLDYELHVLESKVEDVEDGLSDFERHIVNVETRMKALVRNEEQHSGSSWVTWLGRSIGFNMQ